MEWHQEANQYISNLNIKTYHSELFSYSVTYIQSELSSGWLGRQNFQTFCQRKQLNKVDNTIKPFFTTLCLVIVNPKPLHYSSGAALVMGMYDFWIYGQAGHNIAVKQLDFPSPFRLFFTTDL